MNLASASVRTVIRQILKLEERMKRDRLEVKRLERSLSVGRNEKPQKVKPTQAEVSERLAVPDLRDAIMAVFVENKASVMKIDEVVQAISQKYNFTPDKLIITNRLNYLVDKSKKLERGEKRGRYRLPTGSGG